VGAAILVYNSLSVVRIWSAAKALHAVGVPESVVMAMGG
jgi:hypothetical protein